jgi:hypothetical protein
VVAAAEIFAEIAKNKQLVARSKSRTDGGQKILIAIVVLPPLRNRATPKVTIACIAAEET